MAEEEEVGLPPSPDHPPIWAAKTTELRRKKGKEDEEDSSIKSKKDRRSC